jgi:hypothetical protein
VCPAGGEVFVADEGVRAADTGMCTSGGGARAVSVAVCAAD